VPYFGNLASSNGGFGLQQPHHAAHHPEDETQNQAAQGQEDLNNHQM
jgi:hypothetical protein